jgi:hypothetical protein
MHLQNLHRHNKCYCSHNTDTGLQMFSTISIIWLSSLCNSSHRLYRAQRHGLFLTVWYYVHLSIVFNDYRSNHLLREVTIMNNKKSMSKMLHRLHMPSDRGTFARQVEPPAHAPPNSTVGVCPYQCLTGGDMVHTNRVQYEHNEFWCFVHDADVFDLKLYVFCVFLWLSNPI